MSKNQPAPLPGQSDKIVQVENLSKKYGDNIAVNGISFSLTKGEVFAFLGPNGAGKTTTVEILECLRNPTGGQAKVLGYDVSKRSDQAEIRKRIGVRPKTSTRSTDSQSGRISTISGPCSNTNWMRTSSLS